MLSVNPTLTQSEVRSILHSSADKVSDMNGQNFTNEYGYGRLNAMHAVYEAEKMLVEDKMLNFESISSDATGSNQSRRAMYEMSSGSYHTVYQSGSEIVYYKKLPWMTQQPKLLSFDQVNSFGKNTSPNITMDTNNNLHVVWEQQSYDDGDYEAYYTKSTNGGSSWSTPLYLGVTSSEPLNPQISSYDSHYDDELMLTYFYDGAVRAKLYNSSTSSWETWASWSNNYLGSPTVDAIPGTSNDTKEYSAIGSNRSQDTKFSIAYTNENTDHIYYRTLHFYSDWGEFQNLSSIVPGTAKHHSPSISSNPSYTSGATPGLHVAWTRTTGSGTGPYDNKVIHRYRTTQTSSWPSVYHTTYYQLQTKPSITGTGSTGNYEAYLVWEIQGNGGVARQYFDGSSWSSPTTITTDGKYPSLSMGGNNAKFVYTDETGPYFDVGLSSQTLSKSVGEDPNFNQSTKYTRAISFMDSTGAYIEIKIDQVSNKNELGDSEELKMVKIDQDIFDLSVSNALNAFSLDKKVNIKYLGNASFNIEISGNRIEELFKNNKLPKFLVAGDKELGTKKADFRNGVSLLNSESSPISLNIQVTKVGELKKLFSFDKYDFEEGVYASLGHITGPDLQNEQLETVEISTSNDENVLGFSAYPNPFNPSTTISFSLQNDQNVNLTVYDLLGRKVAVLIDGRRTSGLNQVTFDASGLASGIYFYRISFGNNLITKRFTLLK